MKAYIVGLKSSSDIGNDIVFAKNTKEARAKARMTEIADWQESYIDVTVKRYPEFDGLENLSDLEKNYKKFQLGWDFYELHLDFPENTTFDEFEKEFRKVYE